MMFSTHILIGASLGYALSTVFSVDMALLIIAGIVGGLIPELDFFVGKHRKALHYPFSYFLVAIIPFTIFLTMQTEIFLLGATALIAAGVHSFMDIFAGAELRSWDRSEWQQTAVYNHLGQKWIKPRRWAYGGSIQDVLLSVISFAALIYLVSNLWLKAAFTVLLALSFLYGLTIKWFSEEFVGDYSTLNQYIRAKILN
jgi:hypothetical protein